MKPKILLSAKSGIENYVNAVNSSGGIADAKYLPEVDLSCDGLILCGGSDVHPQFYGEEIIGSRGIDFARDEAEFRLAKAFIEAGKPVLGICRGIQLLNIYFGGTLIQDIENAPMCHHAEVDVVHGVTAEPGSICHGLYGGAFTVNSMHHQAIKELGKGLKITMMSADGKIVEGVEHEYLPVFAVQWHPERMSFQKRREDTVDGAPVFAYFIELCKKMNKL